MAARKGTTRQSASPRFAVGIDLGTTNCAMACADLVAGSDRIEDVPLLQIMAPGITDRRPTLPSFHYTPADRATRDACRLPWDTTGANDVVGSYAREQGMLTPDRTVSSAKSWLCHSGMDRTADFLPWHGARDMPRHSPIEITARYLEHLRRAWDHLHPDEPLAVQDVAVTVPASFDETARELTVEAAQRAGITHMTLIEEPQAAFYHWLATHADSRQHIMKTGARILVCDIGGGTTDFTLIEAYTNAQGHPGFKRTGVGRHLILGGDNLDLALAHHVEQRLGNANRLPPGQWQMLLRNCRAAKERLLGHNPPQTVTINLPGPGTGVISGARQVEVSRTDAAQWLLDGFLPLTNAGDFPRRDTSGFREFGLPYARDPAVSRHLAVFLAEHGAHDATRPDFVLLNGGFFASPVMRDQFSALLHHWYGDDMPQLLHHGSLHLAVARGAAQYGLARRGKGMRIDAGLAQSYYLGVETSGQATATAVCLAGAGLAPETEVQLKHIPFTLRLREPVEFPLYLSSVRCDDQPGQCVHTDPDQFTALPPLRTVIKSGKKKVKERLPVYLSARLTETGILEIHAHERQGQRHWRLQFDARSGINALPPYPCATAGSAAYLDVDILQQAQRIIQSAFCRTADSPRPDPARITRMLEDTLAGEKFTWSPATMRTLWNALMACPTAREMSAAHEARWLNLLGFTLRPGFGYPVDDWRVGRTWTLFPKGIVHTRNEPCRAQWWILWRRIAGGLTQGQQQALANSLLSRIHRSPGKRKPSRGRYAALLFEGSSPHESAEIWRMLGSLEHLPVPVRTELGQWLVQAIRHEGSDVLHHAAIWSLCRIGSRVPVHGPLYTILPVDTVSTWIRTLMQVDQWQAGDLFHMAMMARRTGDRFRDIDGPLQRDLLSWMATQNAPERTLALVREEHDLAAGEKNLLLGDRLPAGLQLV